MNRHEHSPNPFEPVINNAGTRITGAQPQDYPIFAVCACEARIVAMCGDAEWGTVHELVQAGPWWGGLRADQVPVLVQR